MSRRTSDSVCRRRGSVVVLVLGMILLVSALMTGFIGRTGDDLIVTGRNSDESRLRRETYSALETTMAVLAELVATDGALHAPEQGWKDPLAYAGWSMSPDLQVAVTIDDETGKLSLPMASSAAIRILFESSGMAPGRAEVATGALLAWTHPDSREFGRGPGRPLRSFAEMALIDGLRECVTDAEGLPNEIWRRIEGAVSLHVLGATNLNTADAAALHALGWTGPQIAVLQQARMAGRRDAAGYVSSADGLLALFGAGLPAGSYGTNVEVLRITVTARSGGLTYRLQAVVKPRATPVAGSPPADKALCYPFQILEFHEDPEPQSRGEDAA